MFHKVSPQVGTGREARAARNVRLTPSWFRVVERRALRIAMVSRCVVIVSFARGVYRGVIVGKGLLRHDRSAAMSRRPKVRRRRQFISAELETRFRSPATRCSLVSGTRCRCRSARVTQPRDRRPCRRAPRVRTFSPRSTTACWRDTTASTICRAGRRVGVQISVGCV